MKPNLKEEKKLWRTGYKKIAGIDEAGRGPLAGPVVACALVVKLNRVKDLKLNRVKDSKKLTQKKREEFYNILANHSGVEWGIGWVSEKVIDRINIFQATRLAMKRAVEKINRKPSFLILDGRMTLDLAIPQKSIVKADEKVLSCTCASIIAKVTRDRMMQRYHKKYPLYCFNQHKGYPTRLHRKMLRRYGVCKLHRQSFRLT